MGRLAASEVQAFCSRMDFQMSQDDYDQFFDHTADPLKVERHNNFVIENSIKKYEAKRAQAMKEWREAAGERSEAVVSYLKHMVNGKSTPVEHYFSKRELAHLRGEEIRQKLMSNMEIRDGEGKILKPRGQ